MKRFHGRSLSTILLYGLLLGGVLAAFKLFEYSYFSYRITLDLYLGIVAAAFLAVGAILGFKMKSARSRGPAVEQQTAPASIERSEPQSLPPSIPGTENEESAPVDDADLSRREREVLAYLVEGHTNRQIAEALFVSPNTVKTHVRNIYRKLDVERRTQAVVRAKELKLVK